MAGHMYKVGQRVALKGLYSQAENAVVFELEKPAVDPVGALPGRRAWYWVSFSLAAAVEDVEHQGWRYSRLINEEALIPIEG